VSSIPKFAPERAAKFGGLRNRDTSAQSARPWFAATVPARTVDWKARAPIVLGRGRSRRQRVEECLCLVQVERVETLG